MENKKIFGKKHMKTNVKQPVTLTRYDGFHKDEFNVHDVITVEESLVMRLCTLCFWRCWLLVCERTSCNDI